MSQVSWDELLALLATEAADSAPDENRSEERPPASSPREPDGSEPDSPVRDDVTDPVDDPADFDDDAPDVDHPSDDDPDGLVDDSDELVDPDGLVEERDTADDDIAEADGESIAADLAAVSLVNWYPLLAAAVATSERAPVSLSAASPPVLPPLSAYSPSMTSATMLAERGPIFTEMINTLDGEQVSLMETHAEQQVYLDSLRNATSTGKAMDWVRFMRSAFGVRGTLESLAFYEDVGWIGPSVREEVLAFLNDLPAGDARDGYKLDASLGSLVGSPYEAHALSLSFIADLSRNDLRDRMTTLNVLRGAPDRAVPPVEVFLPGTARAE